MAARKLLYLLRRPWKDGYVDHFLPTGSSAPTEDEVTVVLLEDATVPDAPLPGRIMAVSGSRAETEAGSSLPSLSYEDLLKLILEADAAIVV